MYRAKTLIIKAAMGSFKAVKIRMCFLGLMERKLLMQSML